MKHGICNLSIIPVRAEASDKSELVTQLLFGDTYEVTEEAEKWLKIKISYDNYEGWIDRIQHFNVSQEYFNNYQNSEHLLLTKYSTLVYKGNIFYPILLGSTLPFYDGEFIKINDDSLLVDGKFQQNLGIKETSFLYYNSPYLWGGKTPFGIDCSGFSQQVFKMNGIKIMRDASQQITQGKPVEFGKHKVGDLAFFNNPKGNITHVGIMLEDNKIIHAHGKVRVDLLDENGIYNLDRKEYSHVFHSLKRY